MKYPRFLLLLLLPFLFTSCLLENEKDHFVDVPDTPDLNNVATIGYQYNSPNYNTYIYYPLKDTLRVNSKDEVSLKLLDGKVYGYEVRIDDVLTQSSQDAGPFLLKTINVSNGVHQLQIKTIIKSGTGSLADKLGAEALSYTDDYILLKGDEVKYTPIIASITPSNGTLKLTWNRYPYSDFQAYEIRKYISFGYYNAYRSSKVTDRNQTTFEDPAYVGGSVSYVVSVDVGGKLLSSKDQRATIPYQPYMKLTTTIQPGRVRLSWNQPSFYKNVKSIQVSNGTTTLAEVGLPLKNFIEFDSPSLFGQYKTYYLKFTANVEDAGKIEADKVTVWEDLTIGERTPPFNDLEYNAAEDAYYSIYKKVYSNIYPDAIYKLDRNLNIIDSVRHSIIENSFNLVMSPNGSRLYLLRNGYISEINRAKLNIASPVAVGRGFSMGVNDNFSASNTNLIVGPITAQYTTEVGVYNFNTKQFIFTALFEGPVHISADGNHFITGAKLYQNDGSKYSLKTTLPYKDIAYTRFVDNEAKLLIATATEVIIYDYISATEIVKYNFPTPLYSKMHFNQLTKKYSAVNSKIDQLDINNGSTSSFSIQPGGNSFLVEGNYIFAASGFALKQ